MPIGIESTLGPFARGSDVSVPLQHADGTDWSGWTVVFALMPGLDHDETPIVTRSTGGSGLALSSDGSGTLSLSSANLDLEEGDRVWTISRTDSGSKYGLGHGILRLGPPKVYGT